MDLKAELEARVRSQAELARAIGRSDAAVSQWVNGVHRPSRPVEREIRRVLDEWPILIEKEAASA